ncbi:uncharacterized protein LOC128713011 [Anopheles marshallii]|uniref:uncharacterized protein LOC128713011 n=1 Tax=Anopheles marshallii TaxID=1521116 RepID=UPI00237A3E78|nr:uncharacterized protein LOC128713011 [Anopheles marshallii]
MRLFTIHVAPNLDIMAIVSWFGLMRVSNSFKDLVRSVMEIVHLLKYSINGQIMYTILSWMYQYRNQVVTFRYHLTYDIYIVLHSSVFVELAMDLQKIFLTYFAWYLTQRYQIVMYLLRKRNAVHLLAIYTIFEDLITFKKHVSQTFGILLLALVLQTFIACSCHAYLITVQTLYSFQVFTNITQCLINLLLFYVLTYAYDSVETKEAELKNALKSMQYTNIKKQTRDQKDFYDLVNLKLMMESPKITACGLFEINLQIFYNVFAAIITYIVILFQFRGFEKSP